MLTGVLRAMLAFGPARVGSPVGWAASLVLFAPSIALGWLVSRRRPENPVGIALAWVGTAPAAVSAVEDWGATLRTGHPWPAARLMFVAQLGVWVWNAAGFGALCLFFPGGRLAGHSRAVALTALCAAVVLNAAVSLDPHARAVDGTVLVNDLVLHLPAGARTVELVVAFACFLGALAAVVAVPWSRYRRGDELTRLQMRWLLLGAGTVPVLLAIGWAAEALGGSDGSAFGSFMIALLAVVPTTVAVAVLRYDLFDIDRLLSASVSWLLTVLTSAAIFALAVYGVGYAVTATVTTSALRTTVAAFVTALCLLPLHRRLTDTVGRLIDRDRTVVRAQVGEFVGQVRDGEAEPERTEAVLRTVLRDPGLRLLFHLPGGLAGSYVDLDGGPVDPLSLARHGDREATLVLRSGASDTGMIVFGAPSARRMRRAREAVAQARLPIEVTRLRLELRGALEEVRASRSRLMLASTEERRRLERDLHDGAQQQIVAVGMRLRSIQRQLPPSHRSHHELDAAVEALEGTVADLRRLAHGIRPARLTDGLGPALRALVAASPVPVDLVVADVEPPELAATTAYYVAAEALANALKHAGAGHIRVELAHEDGSVRVEVSDDGTGGACSGFGLTSLRDRVSAAGGTLRIHSPVGEGTTISAEIPARNPPPTAVTPDAHHEPELACES
ncbi:sensor histidine kinase [Frankia tisae]|uniref:sensor histidine kinase n=1 Tax=Frankia tisae TaxID=2950104 RepID=UPI0021C0D037|nr:ATP-binding protein [Frankia tisae]